MKALVWSLAALSAAGWTGMVWITHQLTAWVLGAIDAGPLKDAGGAMAGLPVPPLPQWLDVWIDSAGLGALQAWSADLLGWLGAVLPAGEALMAWVGPLLWIGWALGLALLMGVAGLVHVLAGRAPSVRQAVQTRTLGL